MGCNPIVCHLDDISKTLWVENQHLYFLCVCVTLSEHAALIIPQLTIFNV